MDLIADSNAVCIPGRMLAQHQAALTLIKDRLEEPSEDAFRWLDLACGRGQILLHLERVIPAEHRARIEYVGVEMRVEYARETEERATRLFGKCRVEVCDLKHFPTLIEDKDRFHAVTITNTVHEITPAELSGMIVDALCRVSREGFMFMYDMESLPELELGAIPWNADEVQAIVHSCLNGAGEGQYRPTAATWPHHTCNGWHIQVNRRYSNVEDTTLLDSRTRMIDAMTPVVRNLLEEKLLRVKQALDSLCRYGHGTAEERGEKLRLLHDYYAISRALGVPHRLLETQAC
jgi:hypothetical protein